MRLSTERILTTHVGSLPRPPEVVDRLMARENRSGHDPAAFAAVMRGAVDAVVGRQLQAGIDIVSDGEASKISYATYIKDRLSGFGEDRPRQVALDLQPYPEFRARMAVFAGKQTFKRQSCVGPIAAHVSTASRRFAALARPVRTDYERLVSPKSEKH